MALVFFYAEQLHVGLMDFSRNTFKYFNILHTRDILMITQLVTTPRYNHDSSDESNGLPRLGGYKITCR
jgi:hypothetical protein